MVEDWTDEEFDKDVYQLAGLCYSLGMAMSLGGTTGMEGVTL